MYFLYFLLLCFAAAAQLPDPAPAPELPESRFRYAGSLSHYMLTESHPFFGEKRRSWMESSARMSAAVRLGRGVELEGGGLWLITAGLDPFGSGTNPASPARKPRFEVDLALLRIQRLGALPVRLTIGRQPISLGSQFLIGDAVYDGFSARRGQAVYHNPRRNFDAVRAEWRIHGIDFDSFLYQVDATWDAGAKSDGLLGGLHLTHAVEGKSRYNAGLFYRHSPSQADNNMALATGGIERSPTALPGLTVGGEVVAEFAGICRNAYYCAAPGEAMAAHAGHFEFGYEYKSHRRKPFAEIGFVWFSRDYTPVAMGFSDWGKWYLGNQIDWIIFGHNTRVMRAQAGFWPRPNLKLRVQYHHTVFAVAPNPEARGSLASEFSYIAQWTPHKNVWMDLVVGDSLPGPALAASGLGNAFAYLNPGAQAVGNRRSMGVVLATGLSF